MLKRSLVYKWCCMGMGTVPVRDCYWIPLTKICDWVYCLSYFHSFEGILQEMGNICRAWKMKIQWVDVMITLVLSGSLAIWSWWAYSVMCSRKICVDRKSWVHSRFPWSWPPSQSAQIGQRWDWSWSQSLPPSWSKVRHRWNWSQGWSGPQKVEHKYGCCAGYGSGVDPSHIILRWDIDGTRAGEGVDPQKVQHKYGAGSISRVDPCHDLRWDIDGTYNIEIKRNMGWNIQFWR